jgi:hypothetical protein
LQFNFGFHLTPRLLLKPEKYEESSVLAAGKFFALFFPPAHKPRVNVMISPLYK